MNRIEACIRSIPRSLSCRRRMRITAMGIALLALAALVGGCGGVDPVTTTDSSVASTASTTPPETVSPIKGTGLPQLVDIGSDSCVPCQMMAGELEELARQHAGSVEVVILDVYDKANEDLVRQVGVRVIPTQLFIDPDGKELSRHEGYLSKEDMVQMFKELGYPLLRGFGSSGQGSRLDGAGA